MPCGHIVVEENDDVIYVSELVEVDVVVRLVLVVVCTVVVDVVVRNVLVSVSVKIGFLKLCEIVAIIPTTRIRNIISIAINISAFFKLSSIHLILFHLITVILPCVHLGVVTGIMPYQFVKL